MIYVVGLVVSMLIGTWAFHELITIFWPDAGFWTAGDSINNPFVLVMICIFYVIGALAGAFSFIAPFLLWDSLMEKRHARHKTEPTPKSEPKKNEPDNPWMRPAWRAARPIIEENIKQYRTARMR